MASGFDAPHAMPPIGTTYPIASKNIVPVLASPARDMSLFNLRPTEPRDVNTQIMLKQSLKSILCDSNPPKRWFEEKQRRAIHDLQEWIKLTQDKPGVVLSPEVIALADPEMLTKKKCYKPTGPAGLPPPECMMPGATLLGSDGKNYTVARRGTGASATSMWQMNHP